MNAVRIRCRRRGMTACCTQTRIASRIGSSPTRSRKRSAGTWGTIAQTIDHRLHGFPVRPAGSTTPALSRYRELQGCAGRLIGEQSRQPVEEQLAAQPGRSGSPHEHRSINNGKNDARFYAEVVHVHASSDTDKSYARGKWSPTLPWPEKACQRNGSGFP